MRNDRWHGYIYPKALDVISRPKVITPDLAAQPSFSLDETGETFFTGGAAGGYGVVVQAGVCRLGVLGLLNSKLLGWFISQTATTMRGGYYSYEARFIQHLPVCDEAGRESIAPYVEGMLEAQRRIHSLKSPHDLAAQMRQVEALESQIDRLVYELYELTAEEIAIVEKG